MSRARRLVVWSMLTLTLIGCSAMKTWMGELTVDKDGTVKGTLEGATGDFHKNTGLNLSMGDNALPALILVGAVVLLVVAIFAAYPIQRALRLRNEERVERNIQKRKGN